MTPPTQTTHPCCHEGIGMQVACCEGLGLRSKAVKILHPIPNLSTQALYPRRRKRELSCCSALLRRSAVTGGNTSCKTRGQKRGTGPTNQAKSQRRLDPALLSEDVPERTSIRLVPKMTCYPGMQSGADVPVVVNMIHCAAADRQ